MAAVLVRLKLSLLRAGLRTGGTTQQVGFAFALIAALVVAIFATLTALGLRAQSPDTAAASIVILSMVTSAWVVAPLVAFTNDGTLDPANFALLPRRARSLQAGLFLAGFVGVPGVLTLVVALAQAFVWARSPASLAVGLLGAVLGSATCVLLARVVTTTFASALASRRSRDVAAVLTGIVAACAGAFGNVLSRVMEASGLDVGRRLSAAADVAGWTPFGLAWAAPRDIVLGRPAVAGLRLGLALLLVAALWWVWGRTLAKALTSAAQERGGGAVRSARVLDRFSSPTGAVMTRCLAYWRRDPRYLTQIASALILPAIMTVTTTQDSGLLLLAPTFFAFIVTPALGSALAYDNSAFWHHVSSGMSMRADRWGRVLALFVFAVPAIAVVTLAIGAVTGHWDDAVWSSALALSALGATSGVQLVAGAVYPGQAPKPGSTPFSREGGAGSGFVMMGIFFATTFVTMLLIAPVIVLIGTGHGFVAWPVGVVLGALAVVLGVRVGGARLERSGARLLQQVAS